MQDQVTDWIDCKDRLPRVNQEVVALDRYGRTQFAALKYNGCWFVRFVKAEASADFIEYWWPIPAVHPRNTFVRDRQSQKRLKTQKP